GPGTVPGPQCDLQGLWMNEMDSNTTFSALAVARIWFVSYHTVVATKKQILLPLQGAQNHSGDKGQPTFGFTVHWQFSDSTTAFVDQCFVNRQGKETLKSTWFLREEIPFSRDPWEATR
ncbi:AVID protein, partial [Columbina picui]|nr:AVID protein [Columbina picui]